MDVYVVRHDDHGRYVLYAIYQVRILRQLLIEYLVVLGVLLVGTQDLLFLYLPSVVDAIDQAPVAWITL